MKGTGGPSVPAEMGGRTAGHRRIQPGVITFPLTSHGGLGRGQDPARERLPVSGQTKHGQNDFRPCLNVNRRDRGLGTKLGTVGAVCSVLAAEQSHHANRKIKTRERVNESKITPTG